MDLERAMLFGRKAAAAYVPATSMNEPKTAKRARISKPKVKSGCLTCKTRRVKCDEGKPYCARCQRFGTKCEGYARPEQALPPGGTILPIQPRIPTPIANDPNVAERSTEEGCRYFRYFCEETVSHLSGYFDNIFWQDVVIPACQTIRPVRHSVIALAALHKSLETAPEPHLKVNDLHRIDKRHEEMAWTQHLEAIQALRQYILSPGNNAQLRTALITCLVFVAFETLQGNFGARTQQIQSALRLLRSYYAGQGSEPYSTDARGSSMPANNAAPAEEVQTILKNSVSNAVGSISDTTLPKDFQEYLTLNNHLHQDVPSSSRIGAEPDMMNILPYSAMEQEVMPFPYANPPLHQSRRSTERGILESMSTTFDKRNPDWFHRQEETPSSWKTLKQSSPWIQASRTIKIAIENVKERIETSPLIGSDRMSPTYLNQSPPLAHVPSPSRQPVTEWKNSSPLRTGSVVLEEPIIQMCARLDGPIMFSGIPSNIPPLIWDINRTHHITIPLTFSSILEARYCWDFLMDRALQFLRQTLFNRKYAPTKRDPPSEIERQYSLYMSQLSAFGRALEPILDSATTSSGYIINPAAVVISVHLKSTVVALSAVTSFSEMVYDSKLPSFRYIVRSCDRLIESYSTIHLPRTRRFSLEIGIIPPLHIVITKCREPNIRRAALALLARSPRQEGTWDSILTARMGRWLVNCEEEGLQLPVDMGPRSSDAGPVRISYQHQQSLSEAWQPSEFPFAMATPRSFGQQSHPMRSSAHTSTPIMGQQENVWMVPEQNRMRLTVMKLNAADRFMLVKCQRALLGADGTRDERETVLAW